MRKTIPDPRIKYIRDLFAPIDEFLEMSCNAMRSIGMEISIGPEDGKLFHILIKSINAKKALEIGTLTGYSSIWIARALQDNGVLYTIEKNKEYAQIARNIFKKANLDHIIEVIEGEAEKVLSNINLDSKLDFIFIDANKSAYPYYLSWAVNNIRSGGIIIADNTYLFDSVYLDACPPNIKLNMWESMRKFNRLAASLKEFESIMLPTSEGLTILRKI